MLITCGDDSITPGAGSSAAANRLARDLQARGVGLGDMVTIALPNSIAWFVTAAAAWKLGAIPQPVSYRLPDVELQAIVELADSKVVVGVEPERLPGRDLPAGGLRAAPVGRRRAAARCHLAGVEGADLGRLDRPAEADRRRRPGARWIPRPGPTLGVDPDGCLLMPGPLYHNGPVVWSCVALLAGAHLVVLPRFDAEATLAAIEEHSVDVVYLVPTMMKRIWRLPDRGAGALRPVVAAVRVAPGRAVPAVAEGGVDRVARPRADLGALRRHRGPDRHDHHGRRVARAPRARSASPPRAAC